MSTEKTSADHVIPQLLMPAEWEPHTATWIAWPHNPSDWPNKFEPIRWVYTEIVQALARSEMVEILCHDKAVKEEAAECLSLVGVDSSTYRLHLQENDRSWLRDSAPTGVRTEHGDIRLVHWAFNGWAKYDNFKRDEHVPAFIARKTELHTVIPVHPVDPTQRLVLEGGGIEVDGEGTILVTEEWLLSDEQIRNPGVTREQYEALFERYLGVKKTIWLANGIQGDDTHGHIDDLSRFVAPGKVVTVVEDNPFDPNYEALLENIRRLSEARDAKGRELEVLRLPMPNPRYFGGDLLPASYANFYIGNSVVIVPTFNDKNDRLALNVIESCFPEREVVGIYCGDLVLGYGTLHCLSQQQPKGW